MADEVISVSFSYDGSVDKIQKSDGIALGLFQDERPLKGITGFADWRLHGMLSRLVIQERLSGTLMESCLVPSHGRLPMEKVFIFGLGSMVDLNVSRFNRIAAEIVTTMSKAQVQHFTLSVWDLTRGRVAPEEAAGIIFRHLLADGETRRARASSRGITFVERGPWGRALRDGFRQLSERGGELPVRLELR
jgi:hypothetical protein